MSTKTVLQTEIYRYLRKFEHELLAYRLEVNSRVLAFNDDKFLQHIKTRLRICLIEIQETLEHGNIIDFKG